MPTPATRTRSAVLAAAVVAVTAAAGTAVATTRSTTDGTHWDAVPSAFGITTSGAYDVFNRTILPALDKIDRLGTAPAAQPMTVDLAIAHPDQAAEDTLAQSIYDPTSANYHHYLTPATYAAQFGIPAATVTAARTWATAAGLTVESVSGAGDIVQLKGTAGALSKAFGVTIGSYRSSGVSFLANDTVPRVPSVLHVESIIGLNTLQRAVPDKADIDTSPAAQAAATKSLATATATATATSTSPKPNVLGLTPNGPFTPQNMWSLYDLPSTNRGSGQKAGIFMEGATQPLVQDLRLYEERAGLPKVPVRVVTEGAAGAQTDNLGADEWDLDTDAVTGMAPDIDELDYYDAQSFADADLLPDFAMWRDDPNGPLQMNASFGECEEVPYASAVAAGLPTNSLTFGLGLGDNTEPMYETVLQAAAMEGRTLFASAGDTAASCPAVILPGVGALNGLNDEAVPIANYPSASKWAISVGGTDIETTDSTYNTRALEYGEPTAGGGSSLAIDQQPWMKASQTTAQPCALDENGTAYAVGTLCRGMPDVSALYGGQVAAGYDTMTNHQIGSGGGTSLSSPLNVGMWTRIQAAAGSASGLGFASPVIYKQGQSADYSRDFYDVTVGFNNNLATPGWDRDSGFGVIDVKNFMQDVTGNVTPQHPAAQAAVADPPANPCNPLITTYSGNANDALDLAAPVSKDPSLDITGGDIRDSADGKSLIVTVTGPTFSPTLDTVLVPFGASTYVAFEVGTKLYYAKASIAMVTGGLSYEAGEITGSLGDFASFTAGPDAVTGSFVTGKLTMTVPKTDVGSPANGTRLKYPLAIAQSAELGPVFNPIAIDAGAGQDYVVGSLCAASSGKAGVTKTTKKKTTKKAKKVTTVAKQPGGTLAYTGAPAGLAVLALTGIGAGLLTTRLRRRRGSL